MNKDSINLPAIPLRGITIFPNMIIHFDVGREKSISALEESMLKDSKIFLVSQIDPEIEDPKRNEIYSIGTICKIKQILKLPKGVTRVLVEGVERAAIIDLIDDKKFKEVIVEKIDDELNLKDENEDSALRNLLSKAFKEYIRVTEGDESKVIEVITKEEELGKVTDLIAAYIQLDEDKKQTILETINIGERIEKLLVFIKEEVEIVKIENSIGKKVKNKLDKSNKEYFLREQLKVIQEELGEDDEKNEIDNYAERISKAKMPKEVREKAERELSRLKTSYSGDGNNIRNYLDWIIELPWNKSSNDSFNIEKAEKILDDEHYGLEEVKERILEYLAVKQYTKSLNGPILCLVGPPGVGKSSIAKSVANSLNRKFARISLGGLRDEAEIRGHRRTYLGAMPGRIIQGMKKAEVINPVFLIDEIDMHLHPRWQWNVVGALLNTFPNVQFIAATHAPILFASYKNIWLIDVDEDEVRYSESHYGMDVNTSMQYYQNTQEIPEKVRQKVELFNKKMDDERYEEAAVILRQLEIETAPAHPLLLELRTRFEFESTDWENQ